MINESTRQQSQQWLAELAVALRPWRLVLVSGNDLFAGVMVWTYPGPMLREASLAELRALLTPVERAAGPGADGPTADSQGAPGEPGDLGDPDDAPSAPLPIPQQILPIPSDPPGSVALERDLFLVLLCDDLPDGDLEQALALVCQRVPAERRRLVLLLADTSDRQRLRRLQEAGADGLCSLGSRGQGRIYTALHAIATGGSYVDPLFRHRLLESGAPSLVRVAGPEDLSAMERSLLREVCRGYNAPEIAARQGLAANSVRHYLSQTYQRIGVRDRAQAIGWSVVNGVMAVEELQTIYLTAERLPLAGEGKGAGHGSAGSGAAKTANSTSPPSSSSPATPSSARKSHPGGSRLSRSRPRS